MDSFLHISQQPNNGARLEEFSSTFESLYLDAVQQQSEGHLDDETTLPYSIANAIDLVCETLMGLSVIEDDVSERAEEGHKAVKAQLVAQHSAIGRSSTPNTSPSSRESSPSWSRASTPMEQLKEQYKVVKPLHAASCSTPFPSPPSSPEATPDFSSWSPHMMPSLKCSSITSARYVSAARQSATLADEHDQSPTGFCAPSRAPSSKASSPPSSSSASPLKDAITQPPSLAIPKDVSSSLPDAAYCMLFLSVSLARLR